MPVNSGSVVSSNAPKPATTTKPAMPRNAVWARPRFTPAPTRIVGKVSTGRNKMLAVCSNENAVKPEIAVAVSTPACPRRRNCNVAPAAAPAGTT